MELEIQDSRPDPEVDIRNFWKGKKVFITGHTGFKGSWLCLHLHFLGADVTGYALEPPTQPSLFELCSIDRIVKSIFADIRDFIKLKDALNKSKASVVFHMAAQPLVLSSYNNPIETYSINVMGTVNLLEAVRKCKGVKAVVNVTTDKCYENREWVWGYREIDPLGGHDPYSNSKACSELITAAYRYSFFSEDSYLKHHVGIATARAGNVIGGGDWSKDRLIPDCVRAFLKGEKVVIRNPVAVRPWQHVLEPLSGYLRLAQKLCEDGAKFSGAWNFGPEDADVKTVKWVVEKLCEKWGNKVSYEIDKKKYPHEACYLKLDCSKARNLLGWKPKWNLEKAINMVVEWTKVYRNKGDVKDACLKQIEEYFNNK
jgi:CDP-glucose 4,6-dehydratase